ncbi:MAG: repair protein radA protein [Candidatus Magasanikbacteria bacterium GW2011_GWA2_56_11]|uniref:DNA repair protein RadA n=1 Tax=Candidatus Magasanikbacteria bacterium GW2011_GWA2_56_11 TaxID=1619044 RepID=A0A0G2B7Q8_9BACT|nr:MAG: repair protein radA protein [Candidatus Magasanikbacteria bacterium GW2011_GWA2_56_11]
MAEKTRIFACANCEAQYNKWVGRCLECGRWGTVEAAEAPPRSGESRPDEKAVPAKIFSLKDVAGEKANRITTGIHELDRVLGGGIVPGSLILLGGEPGIGKSTLAIQLAAAVPGTIYVSAEESAEQIKLRADRVVPAANLRLANEADAGRIAAALREHRPKLAVVDSIQTIADDAVAGEAGSVNQVRACAVRLLEIAKETGVAVALIGHVTKEGTVAGPKTLEHLVDTVLYLEGERHNSYRVLRAVKNRFGATDEVGIFEMTEQGLREVANPSAAFLGGRGEPMPGGIVTCLLEGTRPLLIEVQALVNKTVFGYPVRKASGFDLNRLHVLAAVLQKRAGLNLSQYDIHVNIVGGIRANEPAADLAVCLAIASSYKDKTLGSDLAAFGEVGLGGEVRPVFQTERRLKECAALGLKRVITATSAKTPKETTVKIIGVKNIEELITHA